MTLILPQLSPVPRRAIVVLSAAAAVAMIALGLEAWFAAQMDLAAGRELRFWAWRAMAVAAVAAAQVLLVSLVLIPTFGHGRGDDVLRVLAGLIGCLAFAAATALFLAA